MQLKGYLKNNNCPNNRVVSLEEAVFGYFFVIVSINTYITNYGTKKTFIIKRNIKVESKWSNKF